MRLITCDVCGKDITQENYNPYRTIVDGANMDLCLEHFDNYVTAKDEIQKKIYLKSEEQEKQLEEYKKELFNELVSKLKEGGNHDKNWV